MKLEDLRNNEIGTTSAWIPRLGNNAQAMTHLTFPHFANSAFYFSAQQIEHLEFSRGAILQGNSIQSTVGLWFIAIESYVNSILRTTCLVSNKSFDEYKNRDFGPRLTALFDLLEIERTPFYRGPFQRLEEFKRYRNELFHDRTNEKPLEFAKTRFSGNPMYANQIDVMQASVIAIETFQAFRYAIAGLDLMPQAFIQKEDSFFYHPIDDLYVRVLRPYFEMSLAKHSLTSEVELDVRMTPLDTSQVSKENDVQVLVKAVPDSKFNHPASQQQTNFGRSLFDNIRNEVIFDTKQSFRIANYHRT